MIAALLGMLLAPVAQPFPASPPEVRTVQIEGEQIVSNRTVQEVVPVRKREKVIIDGKTVEREVTSMMSVKKTVRQGWNLKDATAQRADGTKIDLADLKKKLATPHAVVISGNGQPIDKGYLALLKRDTIVIVARPAENSIPGGVPIPAVRPKVPPKD